MRYTKTEERRIRMREYTVEELMDLVRECNSWDGSFEYLYCYDVYEIDDILDGLEISRIVNMVHFGDYNPSCEYFRFDGYGNIESVSAYDYHEELEYSHDKIVEYARGLGIIC